MKKFLPALAALLSANAMASEQFVQLALGEQADALSGRIEKTVEGITADYVVVFGKFRGTSVMVIHLIDGLSVFDHSMSGRCRWMFSGGEAETTRCENNFRELMYLAPAWMPHLAEGKTLRLEIRTSDGTDVLVMDAGHLKQLFAQL